MFHYPPRTLGDLSLAGDRYVLIVPQEPANEVSISLLTDWSATLPKR